ncbi:hypothetical protein Q3A80_20025 [Burkholderia sp. SR8]
MKVSKCRCVAVRRSRTLPPMRSMRSMPSMPSMSPMPPIHAAREAA